MTIQLGRILQFRSTIYNTTRIILLYYICKYTYFLSYSKRRLYFFVSKKKTRAPPSSLVTWLTKSVPSEQNVVQIYYVSTRVFTHKYIATHSLERTNIVFFYSSHFLLPPYFPLTSFRDHNKKNSVQLNSKKKGKLVKKSLVTRRKTIFRYFFYYLLFFFHTYPSIESL